ncbi:MAG: hypothetical protein ACYC63_07525 [Armatimonadota bacterium]
MLTRTHSLVLYAYVLLCGLLLASAVLAADHTNLEEGLPVAMEDAYPTAYLNREFQMQAAWERTADGDDQLLLVPAFEFGFARNWQAKIQAPFRVGAGDKRNSGDVRLEAFYNFNQESGSFPAVALAASVDAPTGKDSEGWDTTLKLLLTKSLGRTSLLHRVNLNVDYTNNASRLPDERDDMWRFVAGYMRRVDADTVLLLDYVHEEERAEGETTELAEIGFRRQVTPLRVLVLGASFGLNDESPDWRLTTGLQQSF